MAESEEDGKVSLESEELPGTLQIQDPTVGTSFEEENPYKIVAAIDFGTTFSGYAYSFMTNKDAIYTNKNWGQTQGFLLHKTPTCLLLKSDGELDSFGFEAVHKYNDLSEDEAASYYFFDRFKMNLYDNKVIL